QGDGPRNTERVEYTLPGPDQPTFDAIATVAGELTLGGMGIAFSASPIVTSVDAPAGAGALPEGAEPSIDSVRPGDRLRQVRFPHPSMLEELASESSDADSADQEAEEPGLMARLSEFVRNLLPRRAEEEEPRVVDNLLTIASMY